MFAHARWDLVVTTFLQLERRPVVVGPITESHLAINPDGRFVRQRFTVALDSALIEYGGGSQEAIERNLEIFHPAIVAAVFAFARANCKNSEVAEVAGRYDNRQQRRLAERKGYPPPCSYHVVNIKPMAAVVRGERPENHPGDPVMPLHICRGNFAHYSE